MLANKKAAGWTLLEMLAVITVIIILISLLYSTASSIAARSLAVRCMGNMRQISLLMNNYLADHNYSYPHATHVSDDPMTSQYKFWADELVEHSGNKKNYTIFICPGVDRKLLVPPLRDLQEGGGAYVSYGINRYGVSPTPNDIGYHPAKQTTIDEPSRLMLLVEMEASSQPYDGWYWADPSVYNEDNWKSYFIKRHDTVNALYCDGHVAPITLTELLTKPYTNYPWRHGKFTR